MALTVVKTTALSGTITNAQLAGSIDLTAKVTGTLPVANGGTALSSGFINGVANVGKINQVQKSYATNPSSASTTSTSFEDSGVTVTLTPSATDSVIIIEFACGMSVSASDTVAQNSLYRAIGAGAASEISSGGMSWSYTDWDRSSTGNNLNYHPNFLKFVDTTHNTTSACVYNIYFKTASAARAYYLIHSGCTYSMTATEILA
tara:strand:+ start:178 stop:789 length:612 start_codon:yes stop_codon:yes gene_type:complete